MIRTIVHPALLNILCRLHPSRGTTECTTGNDQNIHMLYANHTLLLQKLKGYEKESIKALAEKSISK